MPNQDKVIERRKEKLKYWLKDHYNLTLVGILILALAVRLYYFFITKGQALWWDEAEYAATAKLWAFGIPYNIDPQRPPLFQLLEAIVFKLGLGEQTIKFILVLIPSAFLVFVIYLLGKEMYDKKIGLIAAFLATVSWTFVFWTSRAQPDFLSMSFQVLSILFIWKFWKGKDNKTLFIILAGAFAAIGFLLKVSGLLVPLIIGIFIIVKDRIYAFKNKNYYYFALTFILTLLPYLIWSYINFGTLFGFSTGYSNAINTPTPFGWYNLNFFYLLTENLLFILFIFGIIIGLKFLLYFDILLKDKKELLDPNLFGIVVLITVSAFYIFYIRGTEDRWVFLWLPFIFFFAGNSLLFIYKKGIKYNKIIILFLIIGLLFIGYSQLNHANNLIKIKQTSYFPVKQAGLWLKENSNPEDKIFSASYTQSTYYSEREILKYNDIKDEEEFNNYLIKKKPRFLQVSIFERHPDWITNWISKNQNKINPVQVYFKDKTKKQPILIIYEVNYN